MKTACKLLKRTATMARAAKRAMGWGGEEGGALLEMAITMPFMMLLLTGAASFGLAFYNLQGLGNATSNATLLVAGQQGLLSDPCSSALTAVTTALPGWTTGNFSYSMTITDSSGTGHTYTSTSSSGSTSFSCTAGATEEAANEPVSLTVSYSNTWFQIFAWLPRWSLTPPSSISSTQAAMAD